MNRLLRGMIGGITALVLAYSPLQADSLNAGVVQKPKFDLEIKNYSNSAMGIQTYPKGPLVFEVSGYTPTPRPTTKPTPAPTPVTSAPAHQPNTGCGSSHSLTNLTQRVYSKSGKPINSTTHGKVLWKLFNQYQKDQKKQRAIYFGRMRRSPKAPRRSIVDMLEFIRENPPEYKPVTR